LLNATILNYIILINNINPSLAEFGLKSKFKQKTTLSNLIFLGFCAILFPYLYRNVVGLCRVYLIHNIFISMKGTIKTIVAEKNFGFITPEDGSKDIFFHATSLNGIEFGQLKTGDAVSFDVEASEKGPRAANVVLA